MNIPKTKIQLDDRTGRHLIDVEDVDHWAKCNNRNWLEISRRCELMDIPDVDRYRWLAAEMLRELEMAKHHFVELAKKYGLS